MSQPTESGKCGSSLVCTQNPSCVWLRTDMVVFLVCLGIEYPSWRVVASVLGLCVFTAVASAGEINFNMIGVLFMAAASCSDALRLVLAQKLLNNLKLQPMETLYFISPICVMWMLPAAILTELPAVLRTNSIALFREYPLTFCASGLSGLFVNLTSFLLVRRTSSMTLKTLTMARNGGLVIVSALVMGEAISTLEAVGYSGLLSCFAVYTYLQATEKQAVAELRMNFECQEVRNDRRSLMSADSGDASSEGESESDEEPRV